MIQETANANRKHIAFFGKRNAGKSSLFNLLLGEDYSLVSKQLGTTTDPVYKAMALVGYGPVRLIDTAGLDDIGELGELRVKKSKEVRSEEHTSELQSRQYLVCRLLLEKKQNITH